jgi:hypothetical protein
MPNFTYTTDIPDAQHNPSNDQPDMKINTNSINGIIDVDHYGFNTSGGPTDEKGGTHRQVTLTNMGPPGLGQGDGVLFSQLHRGEAWPYWQNGLGQNLMLGGPTTLAESGSVFLAGGVLIQWGQVSASPFSSGDSGTVSFTTTFSAIFTVYITPAFDNGDPPNGTGVFSVNKVLNVGNFKWSFVTSSSKYTRFYWLAIGSAV